MTMTDRSTVVGVFELRSEADAAIYELQRAGFRDEQIGFIVRNEDTGPDATVEDGNTTEAAPGAAVGAVSGGIIGGVIGAAAALLIPGIGPAIAGGILVAVLGGAAIGSRRHGRAGRRGSLLRGRISFWPHPCNSQGRWTPAGGHQHLASLWRV